MKRWGLLLLAVGLIGVPLLVKKVLHKHENSKEFQNILHDNDDFVGDEAA